MTGRPTNKRLSFVSSGDFFKLTDCQTTVREFVRGQERTRKVDQKPEGQKLSADFFCPLSSDQNVKRQRRVAENRIQLEEKEANPRSGSAIRRATWWWAAWAPEWEFYMQAQLELEKKRKQNEKQ